MRFGKDDGRRYDVTIHYTEPGRFLGVELSKVEREFVIHNVTERQFRKIKKVFREACGQPFRRVSMNNQDSKIIVLTGDQLRSLEYHEVE